MPFTRDEFDTSAPVERIMITIDETGTILSASYLCSEMFGFSAEELIGNNVNMLMPEPYKSVHDQYILRYINTNVPHIIGTSRVVEGQHKNGSTFPFRLSVSAVDVDDVRLFVGLIEKVKESFARVVIDQRGIILAVNRQFVQIFQYTPDEIVGRNVDTIMPSRYAHRHDQFLQNYQLTGRAKSIGKTRNMEGQAKNGHIFPISLRVQEEERGGEKVYTAEIQDMETAELAGVLTCDSAGVVRSCNKALLELSGLKSQDQIVGKNISMLMPSLNVETLSLRDSATFGRMQIQMRHADGSMLHASVEAHEFVIDDERVFSLSVRHAEQKLRHRFQAHNVAVPIDLESLGTYVGNYRVGKLLGVGSFAAVFLATHRTTARLVALKVTENKGVTSPVDREIEVLKLLYHENIAQLYEVIRTPKLIFMVMEYVSGGDLFDYVACTRGNGVPEAEARELLRGVVAAVDHCHANFVLHRDLKLENVLLDQSGSVKLVDFGLSTFLQPAARMNTFCGTPAYASPEVLTGSAMLGPESDVWSLGVMLYTLITATMPFQTDPALVIAGSFKLPVRLSDSCKDLLVGMLQSKPSDRITFDAIRTHPWITDGGRLPIIEKAQRNTGPTHPLVQEVIDEMAAAGFAQDVVLASLRNKAFNQVTATYKLILEKRKLIGRKNDAHMADGDKHSPDANAAAGGHNHNSASCNGDTHLPQAHPPSGSGHKLGCSGGSSSSIHRKQGITPRKTYRCKKCDHLDSDAMLADAKLLAELQALQNELGLASHGLPPQDYPVTTTHSHENFQLPPSAAAGIKRSQSAGRLAGSACSTGEAWTARGGVLDGHHGRLDGPHARLLNPGGGNGGAVPGPGSSGTVGDGEMLCGLRKSLEAPSRCLGSGNGANAGTLVAVSAGTGAPIGCGRSSPRTGSGTASPSQSGSDGGGSGNCVSHGAAYLYERIVEVVHGLRKRSRMVSSTCDHDGDARRPSEDGGSAHTHVGGEGSCKVRAGGGQLQGEGGHPCLFWFVFGLSLFLGCCFHNIPFWVCFRYILGLFRFGRKWLLFRESCGCCHRTWHSREMLVFTSRTGVVFGWLL
eukprot:jgi/Mesvir1/3369/Mv17243-RA.2